jgi:nicotinamidase-related amidase
MALHGIPGHAAEHLVDRRVLGEGRQRVAPLVDALDLPKDAGRRAGLTIIYIQTLHGPWTDTPSWVYRKSQQKALNSCREGTWGAEFYEGIKPLTGDDVADAIAYAVTRPAHMVVSRMDLMPLGQASARDVHRQG